MSGGPVEKDILARIHLDVVTGGTTLGWSSTMDVGGAADGPPFMKRNRGDCFDADPTESGPLVTELANLERGAF